MQTYKTLTTPQELIDYYSDNLDIIYNDSYGNRDLHAKLNNFWMEDFRFKLLHPDISIDDVETIQTEVTAMINSLD